ncbi:MAG: hypothetical protein ACPGID_09920, partial [Rubricella sp.]
MLMGGGAELSSAAAALSWFSDKLFSGIHWSTDSANLLGLWPTALPGGRLSQLAALVLALFVLWVVLSAVRARRELPPVVWLCLVFFLALDTYYFFNLRLEARYVLPAFICLILVFGILLGVWSGGLVGLPARVAPVLPAAMIVVATIAGIDAWSKPQGTTRTHEVHGDLYDTALWLRQNAPEATIGAWNAGILSYFSRTEVVNLDGVINDDALAANRTASIDAFIRDRGIDYLVDVSTQMERHLRPTAEGSALLGPEVVRQGMAAV